MSKSRPTLFSIVTPSFKQLDWLRLCVASVKDQIADGGGVTADANPESKIQNLKSKIPPLAVEHIIQDAGSPGIDEFAREIGADFYRDGNLIFRGNNAECGMRNAEFPDSRQFPESRAQSPTLPPAILENSVRKPAHSKFQIPNYSLAIYSERDAGMYDAINRGLARTTGDICAWLNCDEQYLEGTLPFVAGYFQGHPATDVLLGDAVLTDADLQPVCYRRIMVPSRWHTRLDHLHSLSCAMFFRRSALPAPPLDPRWKVISDAVLMDHFLSTRKRIVACRRLLSAYAFTGKNLSADTTNGEHARWHRECGWPPACLRALAVGFHRLRRLLHGAYGNFDVAPALFTRGERVNRQMRRGTLPGRWPGAKLADGALARPG